MRSKSDKRAIEYVATGELTPYARNSRTHSPQQVKQIAASIKEFGFTNPVLIKVDRFTPTPDGTMQRKSGFRQAIKTYSYHYEPKNSARTLLSNG